MRVLVCGSRDFNDREAVFSRLDAALEDAASRDEMLTVIHGCARGADSIADEYAELAWPVNVERYPADWTRYGKRAGFLRNQQMLEEGKPDLVLAFYSNSERSKGTAMMVDIATAAGISCQEVFPHG